ncbi:triadin-like isoform X1 [Nelusetta ayraudi]|uniref:triadin-like isoform X1 n=1 Tax=Nelusetta ayraudi TaxID=303726 RepID=UPI003F6F5699
MTETIEVRSSTTTMVIDSRSSEAVAAAAAAAAASRGPQKTFSDNLHSTFSSPLAWILVLALIITWSCVFVIMLDLVDYKTVSGRSSPVARKVLKDSGRKGGLSSIASDPVKAVNDVVDGSMNLVGAVMKFAASLVAPDEDDGNLYAVRKKGEFLPSRSKGSYLLAYIQHN